MSPHHASHAGHSHPHVHFSARYDRAFAIGLVLNLSFVLTEACFGILANSIALVADAGHNLSDVLSLVLAWGASWLARRPPAQRKTYGWRKSSILAAFFNAVFLLLVTGGIAWEAVHRLAHPDEVRGGIVVGVAAIGIAINAGTALLFLRGRQHDLNLRAAFSHMMADALVSVGVVLAGVGILLTQWRWLDPAFSLAISGLIIFNTWDLLQDSFHLAIDGVPANVDERAVRAYLEALPGVTQLHDLHIWGMSTTETALTVHLVVPAGHPGDRFLAEIGRELHAHFGIDHATLQVELGDSDRPCALASERCV